MYPAGGPTPERYSFRPPLTFWKILENGRPENVHDWERDRSGGRVPPFFKLADCRSCVAGAAYAKSRHDYVGDGVKFVCTNQSCYDRKLAGDEAVHREKVEAELMGADGQNGATIKVIMGRIALLTRKNLRTLVSSPRSRSWSWSSPTPWECRTRSGATNP